MKTRMLNRFTYDGMVVGTKPLSKPVACEVIGVNIPCDPGFVVIRFGNNRRKNVPTCALESSPKIDYSKLLTGRQLAERKKCGFLFGNGGSGNTFVPLSKVQLRA